jgi:tetratricopeptide (TPR) repeat protein
VIEICQRLDGLPLAIELAVARLRLFPPEALLTRLTSSLSFLTGGAQDVPTRQQTLRGTIDWSYSLLPADQQRLFARLAVFVGGWSLQAAETICNLEGDVDVLDGIAALVEQSLVHQEDSNGVPVGATGRFSMLKTIQEYASELLGVSSTVDSVHRRHAEWYLTRLQDAPDLVTGLETMIPILPFLSLEHDNVRAALRWSLDRGDWHLFAGLVRRLSMFWFGQGKWAEALSWTEAALTRMPADPTAERAVILFSSGFFLHRVARSEPATERLQAAAEIWRELPGHERELSTALYALGEHLAWQGRRAEAKHVFEEALSTGRTSGATNAPMVLTHLGILAREDGNYVQARTYMEEGLSVAREMDSQIYVTIALNSLADLARLSGDYEHAEALYLEAMNLSESAGMVNTRPAFLHNLAYVAHHRGNDVQARRQFIEALEFFRDRGDRRGMAECVAGIAVLDAEVDPVRAARLLAAATAAAETLGSHLSSSNQAEYDRAREIIRTELGDGSFRAAWDQGRALPLERAVLQARESRGAQRNGPP